VGQAQHLADGWRWQDTWGPIDGPKYVSLLQIRNKLNFMHQVPLPPLSSYPDRLVGLPRISWEVEKMMKLLGGQNKQVFDELHREIGMIESNSLSMPTYGNPPSPSSVPSMAPIGPSFSISQAPPHRGISRGIGAWEGRRSQGICAYRVCMGARGIGRGSGAGGPRGTRGGLTGKRNGDIQDTFGRQRSSSSRFSSLPYPRRSPTPSFYYVSPSSAREGEIIVRPPVETARNSWRIKASAGKDYSKPYTGIGGTGFIVGIGGDDNTNTDTGQTNKKYTDGGEHHTDIDNDCDDSDGYELELGEEVYVQEIDAVW